MSLGTFQRRGTSKKGMGDEMRLGGLDARVGLIG